MLESKLFGPLPSGRNLDRRHTTLMMAPIGNPGTDSSVRIRIPP
jgi:hypothetical protein